MTQDKLKEGNKITSKINACNDALSHLNGNVPNVSNAVKRLGEHTNAVVGELDINDDFHRRIIETMRELIEREAERLTKELEAL